MNRPWPIFILIAFTLTASAQAQPALLPGESLTYRVGWGIFYGAGEINIFADKPPEHLEHPFDGLINVEHPGCDRLFAGKGQQSPNKIGGAFGRLADFLHGEMELQDLQDDNATPIPVADALGMSALTAVLGAAGLHILRRRPMVAVRITR
jgi:hypothetical protein